MLAEEYCWAITQAAGRSCCGRSGSSALESVFRLDSLVRKYTGDHTYTEFRDAPSLPELNYSLGREVSIQLPYFSIDNARVIYKKRSKFVQNEHARYTLCMKKGKNLERLITATSQARF